MLRGPQETLFEGDRSTESWSVFAQGTYALTVDLRVMLGRRHSDETRQHVGGVTCTCTNDNGCVSGRWMRETLNSLPADAWWDTSVYPEVCGNDNKGSWSHGD